MVDGLRLDEIGWKLIECRPFSYFWCRIPSDIFAGRTERPRALASQIFDSIIFDTPFGVPRGGEMPFLEKNNHVLAWRPQFSFFQHFFHVFVWICNSCRRSESPLNLGHIQNNLMLAYHSAHCSAFAVDTTVLHR